MARFERFCCVLSSPRFGVGDGLQRSVRSTAALWILVDSSQSRSRHADAVEHHQPDGCLNRVACRAGRRDVRAQARGVACDITNVSKCVGAADQPGGLIVWPMDAR